MEKTNFNGRLSPSELVQKASLEDIDLPREKFSEMLRKDITGCYVLIAEIVHTPAVFAAVEQAYWDRYMELKATKSPDSNQVEIEFEKGVQNG